ncbi:MAG: hypothetical protein IJQ95_04550 [Paludibacteraceae bacterium]|nr:hypothetical protein [Paludibacteraceae bacterium]
MRKSFIWVALIAIVAGFASCTQTITYTEDDLHGRWQEEDKKAYVVYTTEKDTVSDIKDKGYLWGYEWDESDAVYEKDVLDEKYGNGWFVYNLNGSQLTHIHMQSNRGADIPKVYTVSVLTNSDLKYKDSEKVEFSYKKVQ